MCQHGPTAKCLHCVDKNFISNVAHVSFDHFLAEKKLKCKGVHPTDVKCNNCLPPMAMRYIVDRTCKSHEPYPKAMCNKCMPPSITIKRQEYRHLDYVEFMNVKDISNFVKYWVDVKHTAEQRVGFLYGYYAEDPHYKGGIRAIVEAIYEPKQSGSYNDFEFK
jgi:nuclear protein localization family protein 4